MPESEPPSPVIEPCPACTVLMDVSAQEPWSPVICSTCGQTVQVRRRFHHYTIHRQVGLGGMSRVFGARDESLGRDLALKILNPGLSQDDKRLRQFEKEAQITASISHPNVVKVYTAGRDQGYFYIAMELVEGGSLDDKIRQYGKLPEAEILELAEHLVQGLEAASDAGLIHRDIKPGNILLSPSGTPKIVDFGLAVFARDGIDDSEIWATPYYVPPETLFGEAEDFRSDIYALGSTLYHVLTGKPLFDSDTNSLAQLKALKSKTPDIKAATAFLSQETVAMLTRTLCRKPGERYSSYDEFIGHLRYARRRLLRGGRGTPWPARQGLKPLHWAGIAAAIALGGFGLWKTLGHRPAADPGGSGLLADNDPTTGTDSSISTKFLTARETLLRGDFANARQQFTALAADPATRQPTLNWAHYNAGLAALFAADLAAAKPPFSAILQAGQAAIPDDPEAAAFFQASATALTSPEPTPLSHAAECPPDSIRAIGLLAAGLKNWHLGDPSAFPLLRAFAASTPPRSASWIDRYKQLAQPYLDEIKTIDALPTLPLTDTTAEAALATVTRARSLVASITLSGAGQTAALSRLAEIETAATAIQNAVGSAESNALKAKTNLELAELAKLDSEAAPLGLASSFGDAAARLRQAKPTTPGAKEALGDRLHWWENADSFLDTLSHDLSTPLEATIDRQEGPAVKGLVAGSPDGLRIKSAAAETALPFPSCNPSSLVALAERILERTADSDEYYRRRELLIAYALRRGLKTYATIAGQELAREHPPFRARWSRLPALP